MSEVEVQERIGDVLCTPGHPVPQSDSEKNWALGPWPVASCFRLSHPAF